MALQGVVVQVVTQAMAVTVEMITTLGVTMVLAVEAAAEVLQQRERTSSSLELLSTGTQMG